MPRCSGFLALAQCTSIGGADRGAGIVRRGGNEEIGELAGLPDHLVGHAIEPDAAGNAELVRPAPCA